jgi:type VI protein secretion system component VasF
MPDKIKIKLNNSEIKGLLLLFIHYNINWIEERNVRLMVQNLISQLQVKLMAKAMDGKEHIISLSFAQAAAFDEAFRNTPIPAQDYHVGIYEQNVLDQMLNQINQIL